MKREIMMKILGDQLWQRRILKVKIFTTKWEKNILDGILVICF